MKPGRDNLYLLAVVVGSLAAASFAYFYLLRHQLPFRSDEADRSLVSLYLARDLKSLDFISFFKVTVGLSYYPFVYYWLTTASFLVLGETINAARMISLIGFFVLPIATYFVGKRVLATGRPSIGLIAALLVLSSPVLLVFSTLAMMEIIGALLAMLILWSFFAAMDKEKPVFFLITSLLLSVLFLTKYHFAAAVLIPIALVSLSRSRYRWRVLWSTNNLLLFGPFLLIVVLWFFPLKPSLFMTRLQAIAEFVPFLSIIFGAPEAQATRAQGLFEHLTFYPVRFPSVYTFSLITGAAVLVSAFYCFRYWNNLKVRTLLFFFWFYLAGALYMVTKSERHIILVIPAAFVLASLLFHDAWEWLKKRNIPYFLKLGPTSVFCLLMIVAAMRIPGLAKSYQDRYNYGISDGSAVRDALTFMGSKADIKRGVWLIGSFDELPASLTFWNFLVEDTSRKRINLYFPPNKGKQFWQKDYQPDLQPLYRQELAKLDVQQADFVIVIYPEKGSLYRQFDYEMANAWQMNYINLMPEQKNYYLPEGNTFRKDGIVVKIYVRKAG